MGKWNKLIDIKGQKFSNWTVLEYVGNRKWLCECSCEHKTQSLITGTSIRLGKTKSCKRCSSRDRIVTEETKRRISINHHNVKGRNNPNWKNKVKIYYCLNCNKEFLCRRENPKYCSNKCRLKKLHESISGENNWNYKGGVSNNRIDKRNVIEYFNWRKSIFERDNYTCQECNVSSDKLQAHHIYPVSTHPFLIYYKNNGITLCKECHKKAHNFNFASTISKKNIKKYLSLII